MKLPRDLSGRDLIRALATLGYRVTQDGMPCVRGLRLTVRRVRDVIATNPSWTGLRVDYPELEDEDLAQVLAFASASLGDRIE